MVDRNRQSLDEVAVPRTRRTHEVEVIGSMQAGKVNPIAFGYLLREDSLNGRLTVSVEQQETRELIMNGVHIRFTAWLVPLLVMDRFEGSREQFDKSWNGKPKALGGATVPFFDFAPFGAHGSNQIFKYLGEHGKPTDPVNTMLVESYNQIDKHRATNRSLKLGHRLMNDTTLASAYWDHRRFAHIVPDFDDAVAQGEIALSLKEARMPIRGLVRVGNNTASTNVAGIDTEGVGQNYAVGKLVQGYGGPASAGQGQLGFKEAYNSASGQYYPDIYTEFQEQNVSMSLANLKVAEQLQAFAKVRERYEGLEDEDLIDMLMDGLSIPDQWLKQPILLDEQLVEVAQALRYSTDANNMDVSAASGGCRATLTLRCPAIPTGAVVLVLAEPVPTQLFERQENPFLHITNDRDPAGHLRDHPAYVRDFMDQQKVDVVFNRMIDTDHDVPDGHFGYEPLNGKHTRFGPRAGGDYYRPAVDAPVDTIRQGIWAAEKENPTLAEDWYRVSELHLKPFLDEGQDPYRFTVNGTLGMTGLTVFGPVLHENAENYEELKKRTSPELIEKPE